MNYQQKVNMGRELAYNRSCYIAGCARNIDEKLKNIIPLVEKLGSQFGEYKILVYENDSTDRTKDVLIKWNQENHRVDALSENTDLPRMSDLSVQRIEYMSLYRNKLLEKMEQSGLSSYYYMIMLDFDLSGFSIDGVLNTIGSSDWDAVGSNGRITQSMSRHQDVYYDIFGHKDLDEPQEINPLLRRFARKQSYYKDLAPDHDFVEVASAFNGLAIYKTKSVIGCRYKAYLGYAEHVGLHEDMRSKGYKVFINPAQLTYYDDNIKQQYMSRNYN